MSDSEYSRRSSSTVPSPNPSQLLSPLPSTSSLSWSWSSLSWSWSSLQLARFYHSIYVYTSLFAVTFGIQLYSCRQRIYSLSLSWGRIFALYSILGLMSLLVSLACYYTFWLFCRLLSQYRRQRMGMQRMKILLQLHELKLRRGALQIEAANYSSV